MSDNLSKKLSAPFEIKLTQGKIAIISVQDKNITDKHKWHFDGRYAVTDIWDKQLKTKKKIYLHRLLLPEAKEVDHINRDKLDNRRENLRAVNRSINNLNQPLRKDNPHGYKGIYKSASGSYYVRLNVNKQSYYGGSFVDINKAIAKRKEMELCYL